VEIREDKAWLLKSRFNPFPISGALALSSDEISFTLDADAAEASLGWLEKLLGRGSLDSKIEAGEEVVAFSYPLDGCEVTWPITGGGAMMIVQAPSRRWVVSYDYPSGGAISQTFSLMSGRRKAKEWKKALSEAEA
jgi:hypothetical protein